ncbi:MAG: hypothetical protein H7Z71_03400 [Moraxellaceae bacterium]|nr:hypothetical protein [Pseudobdellovibrionaceae bacterium]
MTKKNFRRTSSEYYYVTARCLKKDWFELPIEEVWNIFTDYLFFLKHAFQFEFFCFVLMENHFYLIVKTPESNLDRGMRYFMRETSCRLTRLAGRINQTYGAPYRYSILKSQNSFHHAYKYIYRNPVEAGLVRNVEDYYFSTLHSLLGKSKAMIPLVEDLILFSDPNQCLDWLNQDYSSTDIKEQIRKALKRKEFKFGRGRDGRKNRLETEIV